MPVRRTFSKNERVTYDKVSNSQLHGLQNKSSLVPVPPVDDLLADVMVLFIYYFMYNIHICIPGTRY